MNMINRNRYLASAIAVLLGCMTVVAHAAEQAGKILYSRGSVSIVDQQDSARGGRTGAPLYEGDRIVTGTGAIAQIRLSDGALVALRGSSDYQIEKQQYDEEEDLYEQAGKLFTGWMRSITGAIGQKYPQKVSQSTTVATIGIRGTTYQVIHIPPEGLPGFAGEEPGTYVFLEEGEVEMRGEQGTRLLKPGDVVFIPAVGGAPQLAPQKAAMFSNPGSGIASILESDAVDLGDALNETLVDRINSREAPFTRVAFAGSAGGGFVEFEPAMLLSGTGSSRILVGMEDTVDGGFYLARPGATPSYTGYYLFDNGSAVNWGMWSKNDYFISYGGVDPETREQPWHYMIGSNAIDLNSSSLVGQASFSYVGGTPLVDSYTGAVQYITGGNMSVDFGTGDMNVALQSTLGGIGGGGDLVSFYNSEGIYISTSNEAYNGYMTGVFVANGAGAITSISLFGDTQQGYVDYQGTALFQTGTPPTVVSGQQVAP